ncbi:C-type lectin domain family 6 member A-like [Astyanax mexicanus]|uniref:C-type lectin domain family 6 member A-like n=1 Tax=Astyanax mexicanus TaxID=7994 RepID=A0A8T2M5E7_ASTMX|nr:C-type lectin domain family 6 member A-like [Astyanax mexicanus]
MEMDHTYGNIDLNLSATTGKKRFPSSPAQDVSEHTGHSVRERNPPHCKNTLKVLLVALGLLLLCALVALCVLGVLYFNKGVSYESLSDQFTSAVESLSVQLHNATAAAEELKSQLDQVQENYENALSHVASLNETERQYEVLKVKYRTAHEVFSACSECQNCGQCGDGWKRFGVKCYYFSTDTLNWTNSRDHCVEKGGHLVIITSEAEQIFVNSSGETHWIGLNDLETEGKWMWVNKQPLTETGVILWYKRPDIPDEPDNWKYEDPSGENCVSLGNESGHTHSWFDSSCSKLKKFICEK